MSGIKVSRSGDLTLNTLKIDIPNEDFKLKK